ncbi:efflux RND transporter periplasmic adaptor subunit [Litoreibacter roseus]|uniref:RND transporter MFP subunit n=1 Tax=Litoreibacter roseus TaxID=2601869 RepID=A0A6N6JCP7_9RHOB|nr:efflux RND transporter periplasmic adaptor subunit [Litoreibacter roseus]GFE63936.1 RND transporter MFP subunit [Litoreibacter roseus]
MDPIAKPRSILRRMARKTVSLTLTLGAIGAAGVVVMVASNMIAQRAQAIEPPTAAPSIMVPVSPIQMEDSYAVDRHFVGQIEPRLTAVLSFELSGRLTELLVEEGDTVEQGDVLARLDTDLLESDLKRLTASRAALAAQLVFAERSVERSSSLTDRGFTSEERLDQARANRDELIARIAETEAARDAVAIQIAKSELFAPFSGQIGQRSVDGGETLTVGQAVVTLMETGRPQLRAGLPLSVDTDQLTDAMIRLDGAEVNASLVHVRPDIDPVTRTRTAIFDVDTGARAAFGQTATLTVQSEIPQSGLWVQLDALQEGTGGVWTVLVVDAEGIVRNAAVEVLHIADGRAFVQGTFAEDHRLVAEGAHRVTPGQSVRIREGG